MVAKMVAALFLPPRRRVVFVLLALMLLAPVSVVVAVCGKSHQECEYPCIEYNKEKGFCAKKKKVCHSVCDDDYRVDTSDRAPNGSDVPKPKEATPPKQKK